MGTQALPTFGGPASYEHFSTFDTNDLSLFNEMLRTADPEANHEDMYGDPMVDVQQFRAGPPGMGQAIRASSSFPMASASSMMGNVAASDVSRSPATPAGGRSKIRQGDYSLASGQKVIWRGHAESVGGSSVSPVEKILTPSSTQFDNASVRDSHMGFGEDDDEDPILYPNISPTSTSNTGDESFEFVTRIISSTGSNSAAMSTNNQAPRSNNGSGASRASSVAPQSASTNFSGVRWGSVTSMTTAWMEGQGGNHAHSDAFTDMAGSYATFSDNTYATTDEFNTNLFSDAGPYENVAAASLNSPVSFRLVDSYGFVQPAYRIGPPYQQSYPQQQPYQVPQPNRYYPAIQQPHFPGHYVTTQQSASFRPIPSGVTQHTPRANTMIQHPQRTGRVAPPVIQQPGVEGSVAEPTSYASGRSAPNETNPKVVSSHQGPRSSAPQHMRHTTGTAISSPSSSQGSTAPRRPNRELVKREPGVEESNASYQASQAGRRGGRPKHSHLREEARVKSHKMRKVAACWRCALQRDPCDEGTPCNRCTMRSQKGQTYFFDCDRSKLPDFVSDFLPQSATMTLMHQKQTIEDTVNDQVLEWDSNNPIDVYLTSGYGPALRWKLYEFRPKTSELLGQLQYFQDPNTGISQGHHKYSPPFGLMKLDQSDDTYFDGYLDQLMEEQYLPDLGWTCFEEETQIDSDAFQANLLDYLCKLYKDTEDAELEQLLRAIIRMMIITYIMGHTLTIVEETLPSVLTNIKFSSRPSQQMRHISPRLANRQLKFFFAILRNNIYSKILSWQQQTLHTSSKKETTWLTSFCAMLGFAMVLEEVQRTLQIQADAKVAKKEMSAEMANAEANNACERIDARFKLLVGLFQCKYRDKKWGDNGSFGTGTPQIRGMAENRFLSSLRGLVQEKYAHLDTRQHIQCSPENQCRYTSRLVARFLLPFLKLPG